MKRIKPSNNVSRFPRQEVNNILTRKRDLVIRIADWTRDRYTPGYDVEVYIGGVYDFNESESFVIGSGGHNKTKAEAKNNATAFAQAQISKLL